jgi:predicted nucleotidyltransferase
MQRTTNKESGSGISISLQIPASDPDLFKHKATNETLLYLSRHRFGEFTIGELATRTDNTKPAVTRAVDVLRANDLVLDDPRGNRRLVRINRERLSVPEDPFLRIPQVEFHEPVKAAVDELVETLDTLLGIVLYGSVARGEADRRSDIDLWVLVSEERAASQRTVNELVLDLEERKFDGERYGFDIDVEEVSSVPRYTGDVREIVLSGITVYETPQFETVEKLLLNEGDGDE